jgi:hypothetical protein
MRVALHKILATTGIESLIFWIKGCASSLSRFFLANYTFCSYSVLKEEKE